MTRTRPTRWRSKDTRLLAADITAAGGTVQVNRRGHLRVTGPAGVAVVPSKLGDWRCRDNAVRDLRRYAGINLHRT